MDLAVDGGDYERAVRMSGQLAQREVVCGWTVLSVA